MKYALDGFQPKLPQISHTARERKAGLTLVWDGHCLYYYCCCSWIATATRAFNGGCPSGNVYSLPYAKALTKYRGTNIAGGNSFWKQPSSQCYHVTLAAVCSKSVRPYSSTTGWSPVSSAMWQQHNLIKVVSAQNNPVLFLINQE